MAESTVLVIEDDPYSAQLACAVLELANLRPIVAPSGKAGLRRAAEHHDLIWVDMRLPDMDGVELCRAIRRRSNAPMLVVSAHREPSEVVAAFDAGADDYVNKPFDRRELVARARALIRRARHTNSGIPLTADCHDPVGSSAFSLSTR